MKPIAPVRAIFLLLSAVVVTMLPSRPAYAQERVAPERSGENEFAVWFNGEFENGHAFSNTINARLYQFESRYTRVVSVRGPIAIRYVAEVVPISLLGDPRATNGRRIYSYGIGGSPIGAQANFVRYRRFQPFITSGGGFLYFNRPMFGTAQQFNFTAQLGGGVQLFGSNRHRAIDVGYKYHHISNANLDRQNPGMDSHMLFVGVSLFR